MSPGKCVDMIGIAAIARLSLYYSVMSEKSESVNL